MMEIEKMEAKAKFEVGQEVYVATPGPSKYEDCPICYEGISNRLKHVKKRVVIGITEYRCKTEDLRFQYFLDPNKFTNLYFESWLFATREEAEKACFENNHQNDHFQFVKMILDELDAAKAKHPYFADVLFTNTDPAAFISSLTANRSMLANQIASGTVSTSAVLMCEYAEFAVEVAKGDWNAALIELAQVCAVNIRTALMIQAEIDKGKNKEV